MKTKYWIILIILIFLGCIGFSLPLLLPSEDAVYAEVISDGQTVRLVDLRAEQEFQITTKHGGENTITVRDGKIGVTKASCPDHYCMDRGMCSSGAQIVCLPNRLIIRFKGSQIPDSIAG